MPRPSNMHLTSMGYYRVRIDGVEHHLGKDKRKAEAKFHLLMSDRDTGSARPIVVACVVDQWLEAYPSEYNETQADARWSAPRER